MKSRAPLAILLFPIILLLAARPSRAEMWCGDGPGTALSHPCTDDDDNPAVAAAIDKYQDQWMNLHGVYDVGETDTYHNRVQGITVHVDTASVDSVKKQIPTSVDGIPVAIVPGKKPESKDDSTGHYAYGPPANPPDNPPDLAQQQADFARRTRQQEDAEEAGKSYALVLQQYGERWDKMPGVLGFSPKCDPNGCDSKTIEISVQRELLPEARNEIPSSVNGVRIVLTPDDD